MEVVATVPHPPLLTRKEAADKLRISLTTLNKLITEGKFSTVLIRTRRLIPEAELIAFIAKGGDK